MKENQKSPMIQVHNITASYENQLVLQDVSFSLHAGRSAGSDRPEWRR